MVSFVLVEGKPLFERPKGVIDNKEESAGKAKVASPHQVIAEWLAELSATENHWVELTSLAKFVKGCNVVIPSDPNLVKKQLMELSS